MVARGAVIEGKQGNVPAEASVSRSRLGPRKLAWTLPRRPTAPHQVVRRRTFHAPLRAGALGLFYREGGG